jgi:hypothetical protein
VRFQFEVAELGCEQPNEGIGGRHVDHGASVDSGGRAANQIPCAIPRSVKGSAATCALRSWPAYWPSLVFP